MLARNWLASSRSVALTASVMSIDSGSVRATWLRMPSISLVSVSTSTRELSAAWRAWRAIRLSRTRATSTVMATNTTTKAMPPTSSMLSGPTGGDGDDTHGEDCAHEGREAATQSPAERRHADRHEDTEHERTVDTAADANGTTEQDPIDDRRQAIERAAPGQAKGSERAPDREEQRDGQRDDHAQVAIVRGHGAGLHHAVEQGTPAQRGDDRADRGAYVRRQLELHRLFAEPGTEPSKCGGRFGERHRFGAGRVHRRHARDLATDHVTHDCAEAFSLNVRAIPMPFRRSRLSAGRGSNFGETGPNGPCRSAARQSAGADSEVSSDSTMPATRAWAIAMRPRQIAISSAGALDTSRQHVDVDAVVIEFVEDRIELFEGVGVADRIGIFGGSVVHDWESVSGLS